MTHTEHRGHMTIGSLRRCVENWTAAGYPDELPVNVDVRETAEVDENGDYVVEESYPLRALSITNSIPAKSGPGVTDNPLTDAQARSQARAVRLLLSALDRKVVDLALLGQREGDLLGAEGEEVDGLGKLMSAPLLDVMVVRA